MSMPACGARQAPWPRCNAIGSAWVCNRATAPRARRAITVPGDVLCATPVEGAGALNPLVAHGVMVYRTLEVVAGFLIMEASMRPNLDRVLTLGALSAFLYGSAAAASRLYPVLEVMLMLCALSAGVTA